MLYTITRGSRSKVPYDEDFGVIGSVSVSKSKRDGASLMNAATINQTLEYRVIPPRILPHRSHIFSLYRCVTAFALMNCGITQRYPSFPRQMMLNFLWTLCKERSTSVDASYVTSFDRDCQGIRELAKAPWLVWTLFRKCSNTYRVSHLGMISISYSQIHI